MKKIIAERCHALHFFAMRCRFCQIVAERCHALLKLHLPVPYRCLVVVAREEIPSKNSLKLSLNFFDHIFSFKFQKEP
jgi:hypothetical protein